MIFVIPSLSHGHASHGEEVTTPWRRWFAWYPINDDGVIYWLTYVEWRLVFAKGWLRSDGVLCTSRHYEYRHKKITTTVVEVGTNE